MSEAGLIVVNKLKQEAFIGWTAEERAFPRILTIDLELATNFRRALSSDDLGDTVDYMAVIELIRGECEKSSWKLIEKMAADLANAVIARHPIVSRAKVRVTKEVSPLCESVSVETESRRD